MSTPNVETLGDGQQNIFRIGAQCTCEMQIGHRWPRYSTHDGFVESLTSLGGFQGDVAGRSDLQTGAKADG